MEHGGDALAFIVTSRSDAWGDDGDAECAFVIAEPMQSQTNRRSTKASLRRRPSSPQESRPTARPATILATVLTIPEVRRVAVPHLLGMLTGDTPRLCAVQPVVSFWCEARGWFGSV